MISGYKELIKRMQHDLRLRSSWWRGSLSVFVIEPRGSRELHTSYQGRCLLALDQHPCR